jgi:signal transduction histidine kinase
MVLAIPEGSVDQFRIHYHWFSVTRWFFVGTVVAGLWNIRHTYVTTGDESERRRLRWVLWGLFIGFVPFVFLWVIPQSILHHGLMPEEFIVLFSGMIPLAFGISIVRYHIMNIDLIFQRSVVYGTVMGILVTVYVSLVGFVATLVTRVTEDLSLLIAGGSAMAVALLFQPLRRFVQDEVDRRFFRVAYDYRVAQREFLDSITRAFSVPDLAQVLIQRTDALIPVERIACCELRPPEDRITLVAQRGFDHLAGHSLRFARAGLPSRLALPVALPDQIEPGVPCEEADGQVFRRWGLALLFTFVSTDDRFLGFLALGPKRSGLRFTSEDVDLLRTVVTRAAAEIERISLQEELLRKRGEMEHLRALNEVKSEFVSYVSHELKTPLTSIKMFAQLLMSRDSGLRPRAHEYLRIIEGEADRLNRMVSTILEATRIERGMKTYSFRPLDLVDVTKSVMATMQYQMHKDKFRVRFRHPRTRRRGSILPFVGDRDAIAEVLINLLSNAMKYSDRERKIDVTLAKSGDGVSCRVDDRGRGIAPEALPHVFEKFYRDTNTAGAIQGVGLGLSVVKHVMDAHGGIVQVSSTPGKGTSILLWFPSRPLPATAPEKEPRYEENSPR